MNKFDTLGKYHVLESLAASRLAEIYKVKTIGIAGFEKIQVLHRILPRYAKDAAFLRAFIAEAKVAFSLNHRNIVQVFEFGKMDGELFLATEYIPGVNLQEVLNRCRNGPPPIPVGLICYIMGEVAAGLEYAHRKTDQSGDPLNIAHGNLSPHQMGCSWEGSVKVLDFGISRAATMTADTDDIYREMPRYLAPEQLDERLLSSSGDIFSFGTVLWELLTGHPLFEGSTPDEVRAQIRRQRIPSARSINPEVPVDLDDLTLRCLAIAPKERVATATELQVELHHVQRRIGAVIGSRSLATFLQEIFPNHAETRDVRQEGAALDPVETQERKRPIDPIRALVDAAAELAEPQNPPAEAVRSHRRRRRRQRPRDERKKPAIEHRDSTDYRIAGVLRSMRHVDEEVTVAPPKRRRRQDHLATASATVEDGEGHREQEGDILEGDASLASDPPIADAGSLVPRPTTEELDDQEFARLKIGTEARPRET
ncbi:MAG: serine/threonine protein kinase, partial [Deltaproteobacteria bacterium]|nr:serine/threonine protein kinase [Deltaproteobacteria bacterium]